MGGTVEAQRLGGLQIDDRLELGRGLHRKVGGLLAFEDAIDIAGRKPELFDLIGSIGDQAAGDGVKALGVDRRQLMPARQRD